MLWVPGIPDGGEIPVAEEPCPGWLHDQISAVGPDGQPYPTWHPAVDPSSGCFFGHEHGDDPSTSVADPSPPLFGYAAQRAGRTESHFGYKVFVVASGTQSVSGPLFDAHHRIVMHMGTSEVSRYAERYHSLEYDYVATDGSERAFHVWGMADTGTDVTSVCAQTGDGRSFATVGCATDYEIWALGLNFARPSDVQPRLQVAGAVGVFEPITMRDPSAPNQLIYLQDVRAPGAGIDPLSASTIYRGCRREVFTGQHIFRNGGRPTVYFTDAFGIIQTAAGPDTLEQEIASVDVLADLYLLDRSPSCAPGVHAPN